MQELDKKINITFYNKKEGFQLTIICNKQTRVVIQFLNQILTPKRALLIHKGYLANLLREILQTRAINWALLLHEAFLRTLKMANKRIDYSSSFYYHLYHTYNLLNKKEQRKY